MGGAYSRRDRRRVSPASPTHLVCRRDGCHRVGRALAHVGRGPRRRRRGRGGSNHRCDDRRRRLVVALFEQEGQSLVRFARLFVDDRNAAEDLVQEAFIRLARSAHRIKDESKAAAYLRSIVLNLARDNNRRGLVSLRHHLPLDDRRASTEDEIELQEDQREVIEALRELPHRQRTALVLRYYEELGIDDIAEAMGISRNSVKTHLQRGLAALEDSGSVTRRNRSREPEVTGVTAVEQRLRDALFDEADALDESDDLFARVTLSIEDDRRLRRQRRRRFAVVGCLVGAIAAVVLATTERTKGETRHGLVGLGADVVRRDGVPGLVAGAVHPALREELRRRRVPGEPADRQELHRADGRRVLPDLLRVHPVHGAVRAGLGLG